MSKLTLNKHRVPTPVERLLIQVREYLHLPDPKPLYTLIAAVTANMLEGEPVWLMFVGPPGCGKTELIESLHKIENMHRCAHISGPQALLSASPKKDVAKDATGGLFREVGDHGGVMLNDFTSVLTLPDSPRDQVLSALREAYSGQWDRDVGAEGGRKLHWNGRICFFAGVTGAIDRHHSVNAALGERWVYYRFGDIDGWEQTRRAMMNANRETKWREELAQVIADFFKAEGLEFGKREKRRLPDEREMIRLHAMAFIGARCRSSVARDPYTKEIIDAGETEVEGRLGVVLAQLYIALERIGVREALRWEICGKIALDSMPKLRRLVIQHLKPDGATVETLVQKIGCSTPTIYRTLGDLELHKVVERETAGEIRARVVIAESIKEEWERAFGRF